MVERLTISAKVLPPFGYAQGKAFERAYYSDDPPSVYLVRWRVGLAAAVVSFKRAGRPARAIYWFPLF